jgi:hypothetical protein
VFDHAEDLVKPQHPSTLRTISSSRRRQSLRTCFGSDPANRSSGRRPLRSSSHCSCRGSGSCPLRPPGGPWPPRLPGRMGRRPEPKGLVVRRGGIATTIETASDALERCRACAGQRPARPRWSRRRQPCAAQAPPCEPRAGCGSGSPCGGPASRRGTRVGRRTSGPSGPNGLAIGLTEPLTDAEDLLKPQRLIAISCKWSEWSE